MNLREWDAAQSMESGDLADKILRLLAKASLEKELEAVASRIAAF